MHIVLVHKTDEPQQARVPPLAFGIFLCREQNMRRRSQQAVHQQVHVSGTAQLVARGALQICAHHVQQAALHLRKNVRRQIYAGAHAACTDVPYGGKASRKHRGSNLQA